MPTKKLISFKLLKEISGGDQDFKKEVIAIFKRDADEFEKFLCSEAAEKDFAELGKRAHKFKSSVMLFGISSLIKILHDYESEGYIKMSSEKKTALAKKVCTLLKQCDKELSRELKKLG